jgi:hypothetical protein
LFAGEDIRYTVNPETGRETEFSKFLPEVKMNTFILTGSCDVIVTGRRAPQFMQRYINSDNSIKINVLEAYKFRIYPTKAQKTKMLWVLNLCRWVCNEILSCRKNVWEKDRKSEVLQVREKGASEGSKEAH